MSKNHKIIVRNDFQKPVTLWLEPWGADYGMMPNDEFEIIEEEATDDFFFQIDVKDENIFVWAEGGEAKYPKICQNGEELNCGYNRFLEQNNNS